jgi:hypothetical protein
MSLRANVIRYDYVKDKSRGERRKILMGWSPVMWGAPHLSPQRMGYFVLMPRADR